MNAEELDRARDMQFASYEADRKADLYDHRRDDRDEARIMGGDEREDEARRRWET